MALQTLIESGKVPDFAIRMGIRRLLAQRLRALRSESVQVVVGFTAEVRRHLALGDFFIGKPIDKPEHFRSANTTTGFNLNWSF